MIHENIEFHNVVALEERRGFPGLQLQRFPLWVREKLNERGRWNSQGANGTEIRLVTDAPHIRLFVSALWGDTDLWVCRGDFRVARHYLEPGGPLCVDAYAPDRWDLVPAAELHGRFAPNVWRFVLDGYHPVFHDLETFHHDFRPPTADELPTRRYLAYGSSITAGSGAKSYVQQVAQRLGADAVNLAMGGACFLEPEVADFIAGRDDWDFCTLELGVNVLDVYEADEFARRARYFVETITVGRPGVPVVLITPFFNQWDRRRDRGVYGERQEAFADTLRALATEFAKRHVHLVEGHDMLGSFVGLGADLVHPDEYGHTLMAEVLTARLRDIL